jgi:multicomponent Na+:H+ antiporter subunit D
MSHPAVVFLCGAVLLPFLPQRARNLAFICFPLLALFLVSRLEDGGAATGRFLNFDLVPLRVDRLSLAFAYVFTIVAFLGGVYAYHLKGAGEQVAALLYAGSSLGVVFAGDFFTLFVCWEIMAVASVCLILGRRTIRSTQAGLRYIFFHLFGGNALLAGILWRYAANGSLLFDGSLQGPGAYLILLAFCINAAVPPLHVWLADSYPEGTVTGSVFLSAFTTKTAVYVLARGFAGSDILMIAGAAMALYGVVFAFLENDIRRVLAYHIVSQVGYMVAGIGIGTEAAINGSTAHAFAHILYKALLFMGAGAVLYSTGTSKMSELGGLVRRLPWVLLLYMLGALSISGFPLFSGFVSKSLVIDAAGLDHKAIVVLLLQFASVGTFLSIGLKVPYFTWFGAERSVKTRPIPWNMYAAMILLGALNLAIGVYPELLYRLMPFPVSYRPYTAAHLLETLQLLAFTGLGYWLLAAKIDTKALMTLDVDWFYRKPAPLLFRFVVLSLDRAFAAAELVALDFARALAKASSNPVEFASRFLADADRRRTRRSGAIAIFDPDRHRPSVRYIILVVLSSLVVLLAWSYFVV